MTMLRPESEMKDSGIEWIGKMPFNWELHRIRNNYRIITGNGFKPELQGRDSGKYPVCKASDISSAGSTLFSAVNYIDETIASEEHFNIIPANSIIFPKIGEAMKKNNRTRVLVDCCVDNNCQGLVPQVINPVYSYYLLSCIDMRWFDNAGTIPSLNNQKLKDCKIPYPSLAEQQAIASYLDDHCSKLDEIITEAEKSIEEYKELKQAVIFEAVTKGLDKNVPMKDSGIDWIGEIPSSWSLVRIPRILDYRDSYPLGDGDHGMIKTEDYQNEGIPYIRVQNLGWGTDLLLDNVVYISEENNEKIKSSQLKPNDVLFCKTGGTIGKTGMIPESLPVSNTTSHVGKITVNPNYNARYVFYVLSSNVGYRQFWEIACQKTTRPELSIAETRQIRLTWPSSRREQDYIVQYLDNVIPEYDALISEKQSLIEDLKAYKKSLIYEVVTGKRRVV